MNFPERYALRKKFTTESTEAAMRRKKKKFFSSLAAFRGLSALSVLSGKYWPRFAVLFVLSGEI
ncbi:MAG: hypothetical protein KGJ02_04520 [Verrucomicrobiota bacterium]|nr:hypothetical protein [Verrucomicrobiota bacterium]